jgi:8-oxo-dGTP pyrophosphatase MutT (NUDIX family)
MSNVPNAAPPPIRDAASLFVLRHEAAGPRVLMGLRGAGHRFMPNRLVFPGGAVDTEDHAAPLASLPDPLTMQKLLTGAGDTLARALVHACLRELQEETGLHLGSPPHARDLAYICRAVAPARNPIRFDARFFAIDAMHVQGDLVESEELENLTWFGIDEALALDLAFPTRKVLEQLAAWLALPIEARTALIQTPTLREREWFME